MKLLIVEDEKELSFSISSYLAAEKYICESAYDFNAALRKLDSFEYDCVILDLFLPVGNGLDILKEIRKEKRSEAVVIISARDSIDDKIRGLELGADDFLAKPFHLAELEARITSVIRRRRSFEGNNQLQVQDLVLDIQKKTLHGPNGIIDLTRMEYIFLEYLIVNRDRVVTKDAIAEHICGDDIDMAFDSAFIYTHMKNLRKKLKDSITCTSVKNVYGMGYKFCTDLPPKPKR